MLLHFIASIIQLFRFSAFIYCFSSRVSFIGLCSWLTPGTSIHQQRTPQWLRELLHPKKKRCTTFQESKGRALRHYKHAASREQDNITMSRSTRGTEPPECGAFALVACLCCCLLLGPAIRYVPTHRAPRVVHFMCIVLCLCRVSHIFYMLYLRAICYNTVRPY